MTFDPTSVKVTCVTLPKDHCVQVPWEYVNVCGYSDQFCKIPHTYTYYIHTTYYIQNEWSHSLFLNTVQARQKPWRKWIYYCQWAKIVLCTAKCETGSVKKNCNVDRDYREILENVCVMQNMMFSNVLYSPLFCKILRPISFSLDCNDQWQM